MIKYLRSSYYDHACPTAIHISFVLNNTAFQERWIPSGSFYRNEQAVPVIIRTDEFSIPVDKKTMRTKLKNSIWSLLPYCRNIFVLWPNFLTFWLQSGQLRGQSLRTGRGKIFLLSTASRPLLGPSQPPIQWLPKALYSGGKAAEMWSWPLTSN
jgi:hypothetical protein